MATAILFNSCKTLNINAVGEHVVHSVTIATVVDTEHECQLYSYAWTQSHDFINISISMAAAAFNDG